MNRLISDDELLAKFVNMPDLLARVEDDRELIAELFLMFREGLPDQQAALQHAVDAGDLLEVAKAAHALKGLLANLSMEQGARLAAAIENAARAEDKPKVNEIVVAFNSEIAALSAAVDTFVAG